MEERLDDALAAAYLERLGVDVRPGEVDARALARLQRAHLEAVPYENIDIIRGQPPGIEPLACVRRVLAGRGGYCYHLNGAFSALLDWLRVDFTKHLAGVQGRAAPEPPGANGNHLGLTARVEGEGGEWLVDVGLGDGPAEPVPLAFGVHEQDGHRYSLEPSPLAAGGWRFHHDPRGSWFLFDVAPGPVTTDAFQRMHVKLSTSPESGFVRTPAAMRRGADGVQILRGCVLTEREGTETRTRDVESADEWWGLIIDRIGLAYGDVGREERDEVWRRVRATHDEWVAAGRH
jgi:N-hydroxyarylamine O-acetyltransferase